MAARSEAFQWRQRDRRWRLPESVEEILLKAKTKNTKIELFASETPEANLQANGIEWRRRLR